MKLFVIRASLMVFSLFIQIPLLSLNLGSCWAVELPAENFPIGVFAVQKNHIELASKCGFEIIHEYRFEEGHDRDDELSEYLDTAQQYNLKVFVGFDRGTYFNEKR